MNGVEEIKERNETKISNIYPLNIDPQYMKVLEDDITYLLSLLETRDNEIKALEGLRMSLREEIERLKDACRMALRFGTFHQINEELEAKKFIEEVLKAK
jgi:hypothetical protein